MDGEGSFGVGGWSKIFSCLNLNLDFELRIYATHGPLTPFFALFSSSFSLPSSCTLICMSRGVLRANEPDVFVGSGEIKMRMQLFGRMPDRDKERRVVA